MFISAKVNLQSSLEGEINIQIFDLSNPRVDVGIETKTDFLREDYLVNSDIIISYQCK